MRTGENPARSSTPAFQPAQVGVALLVYIPEQSGYFAESLQVLDLQVASLRANTAQDFNLLIFDNGSCAEVKAELARWQESGRIDMLFSSAHNHGKAGAINWIFGAMPNELIVFSDSDVFFRRGWLDESLKLLAAFPGAGMITAQPCFFDTLKQQGKAQSSLDPARFERFDYLPDPAIAREFVNGLGFGEDVLQRYLNKPLPAARGRDSQTAAVLAATHMQFLIPREAARRVLPLQAAWALSPEEDLALDRKVDESGFLRLSTLTPLVVHMGNHYDPAMRAELSGLAEPAAASAPTPAPNSSLLARLLQRMARVPRLRAWMRALYRRLFQALSSPR